MPGSAPPAPAAGQPPERRASAGKRESRASARRKGSAARAPSGRRGGRAREAPGPPPPSQPPSPPGLSARRRAPTGWSWGAGSGRAAGRHWLLVRASAQSTRPLAPLRPRFPLQPRRRRAAPSRYPGNRQRTLLLRQLSEASSQPSLGPLRSPRQLLPARLNHQPFPRHSGNCRQTRRPFDTVSLLLQASPPRPARPSPPAPPGSSVHLWAPRGHCSHPGGGPSSGLCLWHRLRALRALLRGTVQLFKMQAMSLPC